jgi:hypothetical protein
MVTSCAEELVYTAPTESEVNEFITKNSINVLDIKETYDFTIVLIDVGQNYGYYTLSKDQKNDFRIDKIETGRISKSIFIDEISLGKTPFVNVVIYNEDILDKAKEIEITFKDGNKVTEKISSKGTIILYNNVSNEEQMPYIKLVIYDKDRKILYQE